MTAAATLDGITLAATALVERGDLLGAIDLLQAADAELSDPGLEAWLVRLRHQAFELLDRQPGRAQWPPLYADRFAGVSGDLVSVTPSELSAEVLGSALVNHGALSVPGLFAPDQVGALVDGIDRALRGYDAWKDEQAPTEETEPWFVRFRPRTSFKGKEPVRQWVRQNGGVWAADSPRVLAGLVDGFLRAGLDRVLGGYFGERPVLSVDKSTLRRVPADIREADWHQDGAFLGDHVRTVNVWLALSDCGSGTDRAGMDLVPRRLSRVVETGTEGARFDWSVGPGLVDRLAAGTPVIRPTFRAGDALLFDDLFLHRTAADDSVQRERYAVESWFFAPSAYPPSYFPLVF